MTQSNNTYNKTILELNNDSTLMPAIRTYTKCMKCLTVLTSNEFGDFCDQQCRNDYYQEIRRDMRDFI